MKLIRFYKESFSGLKRDIWALALIYLVNRCGEMVIPFMSVYLTSQLEFSKTESGLVLFCFGLGALFGSHVGGYLTDRIGNFKVMAMSLTGTGLGFLGILMFETFFPLCGWMILTALFSSMFSPAAFSAVTAWGDPANQTRGFSLLRMAINLGIAIGPAVGGLLAHNFGYSWVFIVDGLTCFIAVWVLFQVLSHKNRPLSHSTAQVKNTEGDGPSSSSPSPYRDGILLTFLFLNLINMVAFFQILFSVPVYFKEEIKMSEDLIGYFFTANGLLVFLLEMPLVFLIEKHNKFIGPMVTGAILIGLGFASLNLFASPLHAIISYSLLIALGEVINFPLIPTLAMRRSNSDNQGKYMGVVSMMFAMAFLLAPASGLPIIEKVGYDSYYLGLACLSMLSGLGLWILRKWLMTAKEGSLAQVSS